MSIKNFWHCFVFLIISFISGCGKKEERGIHENLARNYYKMSCIELAQENPSLTAYKKALQYIDSAIVNDKKPEYMAQRATLLFLLRQIDESFTCFEGALELDMHGSLRSEIMNNYACLLGSAGKYKEALNILGDLEWNKDYMTPEVALVNQAKVYFEQGKLAQAKNKLQKAGNIMPSYVDAHYYLAAVNFAMKNNAEALDAIDATLLLESNHHGAKLLKKKIC